jgi:prepilin-type N-terminal cleavage/methylation domain-containing protein
LGAALKTQSTLSPNKLHKLQAQGFTLIEVMVALAVFAFFVTTYIASEGNILSTSLNLRQEQVLQKLCLNKLNEIILDPPLLDKSLTLAPIVGNFEKDGYIEYEFSIKYKILQLPDLSQLQGKPGSGNNTSGGGSGGASGSNGGGYDNSQGSGNGNGKAGDLNEKVFTIIKDNIEKMLWQVEVKVNKKGEKFSYILSTLLQNDKAKVEIRF